MSAIANVELGRSVPGWDTVRAIAAGLDVTLVELAQEVEAHTQS
jgi:transcriptional regulator with XRE-family HTH domain